MIIPGIIASSLSVGGVSDPDFSSVKVLLGFNGTDASTTIIDESGVGRTFTANGNAQLDTAIKKFGTASLLVDGAGDYVDSSDAADLQIGSGNFTLEGFVRFTSDPSAFQVLFGKWQSAGGQRSYTIFRNGITDKLELFLSTLGFDSVIKISANWTLALNQQFHIAVDFDGTTYRLYVDGVVFGTATTAVTTFDNTVGFSVGAQADGANPFDGHIDEVRLTVGVARFAGAFTPPTEEFPRS